MKIEPPNNAPLINDPSLTSATLVLSKPALQAAPVIQANAAEEVAMLFSSHVERSSKALDKRQLDLSRADVKVERVEKLEKMLQWYSQLGHPGRVGLVELARQTATQLQQQPSLASLLKFTGADPARADVVLQCVSAQAEAEGRKRDAALARDFLERLRKAYGAQIKAGMNIANALQTAGGDPALRQAVRQLYYDSVVLKQSLPSMLQALLGLFGEEEFEPGLDMMRCALADDIAAQTPSRPSAKLRVLLLGLHASSQLSCVLQSCRQLLERLATQHSEQPLSAVALLQRMIRCAGAGFTANEAQRLGRELGGEQPQTQLVTLNALYPMIQRLPLPLWRDGKSRQASLKVLLGLLDERARDEPRAQAAASRIEMRV